MKKQFTLFKRLLALALVLALVVSPLPLRAAAETPADTGLVLESKNLTAFAAGAKADGEAEKMNDVFTLLCSSTSKVDTSAKTWDDGYESSQRIYFGGKATTTKNALRLDLTGGADVKVWWVAGGDSRQIVLLNADAERRRGAGRRHPGELPQKPGLSLHPDPGGGGRLLPGRRHRQQLHLQGGAHPRRRHQYAGGQYPDDVCCRRQGRRRAGEVRRLLYHPLVRQRQGRRQHQHLGRRLYLQSANQLQRLRLHGEERHPL